MSNGTFLSMLGVDIDPRLDDAIDQRLWGLIDRELDSGREDLGAPGQSTPLDRTITKTSDNETGTAKVAGSGSSIVGGVDNRVIYAVGAATVLGLIWAVTR